MVGGERKCLNGLYLSFHDLDGTHNPTPAMKVKLFTKEAAQKLPVQFSYNPWEIY